MGSASEKEGTTAAAMDDARQFLQHLPPNTPVYSFAEWRGQGHQLLTDTDFIVIKHVPPQALDQDHKPCFGRIDYSRISEILILKMVLELHEAAAENFTAHLMVSAGQMGVKRRISKRGSTRTDTSRRSKEADRSWAPAYRPGQAYREWPTVALESNGQVLQGLIIDIEKGSGNVNISSWAPPMGETRPGYQGVPEPINSIQPLPARKTFEAVFEYNPNGKESVVEGDDITFPFTYLVDEPRGEKHKDFVLTKELLLTEVVEPIWEALNAMKTSKDANKKKS